MTCYTVTASTFPSRRKHVVLSRPKRSQRVNPLDPWRRVRNQWSHLWESVSRDFDSFRMAVSKGTIRNECCDLVLTILGCLPQTTTNHESYSYNAEGTISLFYLNLLPCPIYFKRQPAYTVSLVSRDLKARRWDGVTSRDVMLHYATPRQVTFWMYSYMSYISLLVVPKAIFTIWNISSRRLDSLEELRFNFRFRYQWVAFDWYVRSSREYGSLFEKT